MRFVLAPALLAVAAFSSAAEINHRVNVALNFDGTRSSFTVPQFNPTRGILTEVRVRAFVRATASLGIENTALEPGLGRGGFSGGANLEADVPGLGTYYLAYSGFMTKGREKNLSAYDGSVDWAGTSGGMDNFVASAGVASTISDPLALSLVSGVGTLSLTAYLSSQLIWQWYNGRTAPWPEMSLAGSGNVGVVVTYVYTPF